MLQVTNGVMTLTVTKSAFKTYYERNGFYVKNGAEPFEDKERVIIHPSPEKSRSDDSSQFKTKAIAEDDEVDNDEVSEDEVDLSEIPLSEMSFEQLHDYAEQLGLDHDSIRSKKELRILIREYLKNS